MVDKINEILLSHSTVLLRDDGMLEVNVKESSDIGVDECQELTAAYESLLGEKKCPLLHIVGDYVTMDKEARDYASSELGLKFSIAEAFVINSLPHKILANFYMKVQKPSVPTKFFKSKSEAEDWLSKYL